MDILNIWQVATTVRERRGEEEEEAGRARQKEMERGRVRGGEEVSPVYFIQWQQSTIHNQVRLIHSFN